MTKKKYYMGIDTASELLDFSAVSVMSKGEDGIFEFHECKTTQDPKEFIKLVKELAKKYRVEGINWFNKFLGYRNNVISFKEINDYIQENYPEGIVNKLTENRK